MSGEQLTQALNLARVKGQAGVILDQPEVNPQTNILWQPN